MGYINFVLLLMVVVFSACTVNQTVPSATEEMNPTRLHLEFLTREGCKNTPVLLENLRGAIANGKISADYAVIQQGTLPPDDPRVGYPTPTILLNGKDIFGLAVPDPPFPEPA